MSVNSKIAILAVSVLLAAAPAWAAARSSEAPGEVTLHAVAVNMSNVGQAGATPIDIGITDWTTNEEATRLKDALREKGPRGLTSALQDLKRVGYIRHSSGGLGWSLRYAKRIALPDGGYRIVFATDRPMTIAERFERPLTAEYDLVVGEVRVGADGKGEGKLVPMAAVTYDETDDTIDIENYASQPVTLSKVTELGSKPAKKPAREDVK